MKLSYLVTLIGCTFAYIQTMQCAEKNQSSTKKMPMVIFIMSNKQTHPFPHKRKSRGTNFNYTPKPRHQKKLPIERSTPNPSDSYDLLTLQPASPAPIVDELGIPLQPVTPPNERRCTGISAFGLLHEMELLTMCLHTRAEPLPAWEPSRNSSFSELIVPIPRFEAVKSEQRRREKNAPRSKNKPIRHNKKPLRAKLQQNRCQGSKKN